jgi:hypothetical protein
MKMRKTIVGLMVLVATAAVAQAEPLKVTTGAAVNPGDVTFTLSVAAPEGSDAGGASVNVVAPIFGAMSAQEKVVAIADAVANAGAAGTWRAVSAVGATSMSFELLVGDTWTAVDSITNLVDTTGSGTQLQTQNQVVDFSLDINPDAVAVGTDAEGMPSFTTVSVTNTLTFTRANQPGDTAEALVGAFEAFLIEQQPEGVTVERTGPTSLKITLDGSSTSAINLQVTDAGLLDKATAGATVSPAGFSQVIDR